MGVGCEGCGDDGGVERGVDVGIGDVGVDGGEGVCELGKCDGVKEEKVGGCDGVCGE